MTAIYNFTMVPVHHETKRQLEELRDKTGTSYDFLIRELIAKAEVKE